MSSYSLDVSDALEVISILPSESVDLVFLDPPFGLGKTYSRDPDGQLDELPEADYLKYMSHVIRGVEDLLRPGGSLFVYHLPEVAVRLAGELTGLLDFRHWIAVSMKNGFARGERLYPAHYALLYYSKGPPATFTRPRIKPQMCKSCGDFAKDYGGYRDVIEEKGVNLSDVWDDLSPVRHSANKHRLANQLPRELTDRVVSIAGVKEGLLLDPFAGTGTACVSALEVGMNVIASDLSEEAVAVAGERLALSGAKRVEMEGLLSGHADSRGMPEKVPKVG